MDERLGYSQPRGRQGAQSMIKASECRKIEDQSDLAIRAALSLVNVKANPSLVISDHRDLLDGLINAQT